MAHAVAEIFLWLFGLCAGSFLNVVIYRLPMGLSIADPPRSFCPHCQKRIAWYDNLPLLSWFLLRGQCRHCAGPISVQYPLVEGLTGLLFVLLYHLLFVAQARASLPAATLPGDLPLLLSWLALGTSLVACAAMDIASYTVDVRVTNTAAVAGILLAALWPQPTVIVAQSCTPLAAASTAAFLVSAAMLWWAPRPASADEHELTAPDDNAPTSASPAASVAGIFGSLLTVGLTGMFLYAAVAKLGDSFAQTAVTAALATAFVVTVLSGGQLRPVDDEIRAAIEDEQPHARRMAWRELLWLAPAVGAGGAVFVGLDQVQSLSEAWHALVSWAPLGASLPVGGAVYAIHGAILAAAAGWILRLVFTFALGREAFGLGDIYILAAAGATAGWDITLLGLLLSVGIALAGWLAGLLLKCPVIIPFGPWLALGLLAALSWSRPAFVVVEDYRHTILTLWHQYPGQLLLSIGLVLVATAAALVFARLLRRWIGA